MIQNNLKFEAAKKEEEAAMKASELNENKYKWTDDMIVNKINWKYGDDCQAKDPVDGKLHDAKIVNIFIKESVMVKFKESGSVTVTKLDSLEIPKNGESRTYKTYSAEDMEFIITARKEHLKRKKEEFEKEKFEKEKFEKEETKIERKSKRIKMSRDLNNKSTCQEIACRKCVRSCGE